MATAVQKPLTAAEFLELPSPPEGVKLELVRGEVEAVCRPGFLHGRTQLRVGGILDQFGSTNAHGRATVKTGVVTEKDPDTVRGPDVSYWSAQRLPLDQDPRGYPDTAPNLAVEVLSPSNRMRKILAKMAEYFRRGVEMVWVVDPEDRTVTVYRSVNEGRLLHENATLNGEEVLPGFSCRVGDLMP